MLVAMAMKLNIEACGHEVIGISSTEKMFWEFMEGKPDLILLDVELKNDGSGIEIAKKLREFDRETRIIFATSDLKNETEIETSNIGNSTILNKPIHYEDLAGEFSKYA